MGSVLIQDETESTGSRESLSVRVSRRERRCGSCMGSLHESGREIGGGGTLRNVGRSRALICGGGGSRSLESIRPLQAVKTRWEVQWPDSDGSVFQRVELFVSHTVVPLREESSFFDSECSSCGSSRQQETMAGVDIDTLTMVQYLALSRENLAPGVVKPEIGGNVNFKIKSQFMRELREDTFLGNKDEDAHDHIDRVLNIVALFNIPGVSKDADLLKKAFIQRYCPSSMTVKQLEDIHNFKQEGDESLYQAWERTTSRNVESSSSKDGLAALVNKLDNLGRDMKKLKENVYAIQVRCQICKGPHLDKDSPLNEEVKQVEEVRYGEFGRTTPFNGNKGGRQILAETIKKYIEEASMRQVKQDEWLKTFCQNLEKGQNHHDEIIKDLKSKVTTLAKEAVVKTDKNEDCKAIFTNDGAPLYTPFYYSLEEIEYFSANFGFSDDDELKNITSIPDEYLKQISPKQTTTHYIEPYVPPIPFPRRLEQHAEEALIHKTMETNKPLIVENEDVQINRRCSALHLNQRKRILEALSYPAQLEGIGKLETIKMNIELADNSKCISKGIVRNLLIKVDKFILPIDYIVLDFLEDFRMLVILGRSLLVTAHAKVDVLKKSISLEVGNEKVIFKMKNGLPDIRNESVLMIKSNMIAEEDELMNIEYDLFTYTTNTCESCQILAVDTDLFTYEVVTQETYDEITHNCCLTAPEAIGGNTEPFLGKPH
ncbi:hypothetical protein Tco_0212934 [Tanacetum coccineum]